MAQLRKWMTIKDFNHAVVVGKTKTKSDDGKFFKFDVELQDGSIRTECLYERSQNLFYQIKTRKFIKTPVRVRFGK